MKFNVMHILFLKSKQLTHTHIIILLLLLLFDCTGGNAPLKPTFPTDSTLDGLEKTLIQGGKPYFGGSQPSSLDAKNYDKIKGKILGGYPKLNSWAGVIANFGESVRNRWV
jgi:hypothetical protein